MKKVVSFLNRNYATVWLAAGVIYQLLGESDIAMTMFTFFLIEDVFDNINMILNKSK